MPQRYFELFDDVSSPGNWQLGLLWGHTASSSRSPGSSEWENGQLLATT